MTQEHEHTEQTDDKAPDAEKEPTAENPQPEQTGDDERAKLRKEAANYRRRLRDTEAERDEARASLAATRRGEVERALAEHLADPNDLLTDDADLDRFYSEGKLDPEAIKSEAAAAIKEHPHWRPQQPAHFDGGARDPAPDTGPPSFGEGIKQALRGQ